MNIKLLDSLSGQRIKYYPAHAHSKSSWRYSNYKAKPNVRKVYKAWVLASEAHVNLGIIDIHEIDNLTGKWLRIPYISAILTRRDAEARQQLQEQIDWEHAGEFKEINAKHVWRAIRLGYIKRSASDDDYYQITVAGEEYRAAQWKWQQTYHRFSPEKYWWYRKWYPNNPRPPVTRYRAIKNREKQDAINKIEREVYWEKRQLRADESERELTALIEREREKVVRRVERRGKSRHFPSPTGYHRHTQRVAARCEIKDQLQDYEDQYERTHHVNNTRSTREVTHVREPVTRTTANPTGIELAGGLTRRNCCDSDATTTGSQRADSKPDQRPLSNYPVVLQLATAGVSNQERHN